MTSAPLIDAALETFTELTNVIRRQRGEPAIDSAALDTEIGQTPLLHDSLIGWCHVHGLTHLRVEGQLAMVPKAMLEQAMRATGQRLGQMIRREAARPER